MVRRPERDSGKPEAGAEGIRFRNPKAVSLSLRFGLLSRRAWEQRSRIIRTCAQG
ncbi:MAG: hypothetical protein RLZZ622_111, partial [Planctomycetota bacterium]